MSDYDQEIAAQIAALKAANVRLQQAQALLERLARVGGAEGGVDAAMARALIQEFGVNPDELSGDDVPALVAAILTDLGLDPGFISRLEAILRQEREERDLDGGAEED